MEQNTRTTPEPQPGPESASLVERLLAIRARLYKLAAVYAVTTSFDLAVEADKWKEKFHELANELGKCDPDALDSITAGHHAILFAEPIRKPTIPLELQQRFDQANELREQRAQRRKPPEPKPGHIPDGLPC